MSVKEPLSINNRPPGRPRWHLEFVLLCALAVAALSAATALLILKRQHERQAQLAATESVLKRGEALLDTLGGFRLAATANLTPALWRHFSTVVDGAFAVRPDIQSIAITRNGETIFQRQATALQPSLSSHSSDPPPDSATTEISQAALEVGGVRQPVFVITRARDLPDGSKAVIEATFKVEEVGDQAQTARTLVASLFTLSTAVLALSFAASALALLAAVARDRKREARARQEEHLAFSGVLANGILHDFRNPMSAVRLDAQMLEREIKRGEGFRAQRVADLAQRISRAMGRMDKVFQEFLFLAKPADEHLTALDLTQVVEECVDTLLPRCEQANVTIKRLLPSTPLLVNAHPFALRRALLNVLLNAIQFSPPGTAVTLRANATAKKVDLEVCDQGPGIPAPQRESIFDIFTTTRPEGTGLGLFLARSAIERCGGTIKALPHPTGGALLRISLPSATTIEEEREK